MITIVKATEEERSAWKKHVAEMSQCEVGDKVVIKPLWNQTEQYPNKIKVPCEILKIQKDAKGCASGILITIKTNNGSLRELDSGWFTVEAIKQNSLI